MNDVQKKLHEVKTSAKNSNWEVILTDPSLSKFGFGQFITDKYIMTDIISPLGQKSILYNTVSSNENQEVVISLNFEDIDQTNIETITVHGEDAFFENWKVILKDNRSSEQVELSQKSVVPVSPKVELNKLKKIGFIGEAPNHRKTSLFTLFITKNL